MKELDEILQLAKKANSKNVAVALAEDKDTLISIKKGIEENIIKATLVGNEKKIREISKNIDFDLGNVEVINELDIVEASKKAVALVSSGKCDILMKGIVDTDIIMKAVIDKEIGLRMGKVLSHISVFKVDKYHKLLFFSDPAMNIEPKLRKKRQILENAVELVHAIGIKEPKVAVICAKEKVNPKMRHTLDAAELVRLNQTGEIDGCIVGGPFALDNAISKKAAEQKGINHPVAGDADILLMPDIETGNVFYKALVFLANSDNVGLMLGARAPIVLTSRADNVKTKLNSIALAVLLSEAQG